MKAAVAFACAILPFAEGQDIDAAFRKFWTADSPASAARAAGDISRTKVSFDEALRRLKAGRTYQSQKPGVIQGNTTTNDVLHFYSINVPAHYDSTKRYQVRIQLHGGVGGRTDGKPRGSGEIGQLAAGESFPEQFYVLPYAWDTAPWWSDDQVMNLAAIIDSLKRTYNIDENRVVVSGVSDGGTGAYYIAMRDTTPYASFLPLNGFIMVLGNEEMDDGRIYPNNLRSKPLFVVNGGKDRLYPTNVVEPYTRYFMRSGVDIEYHPQPEGEHNTRWWPELRDSFETFVAAHPRVPYPDRLSWETGATSGKSPNNRNHWVVIDQLGAIPGREFTDLNMMAPGEPLFARNNPSGRVDLVRKGNVIEATTQNVAAFTLLLSPDVFDFDRLVRVVANGREVFNGRVQRDLKTLLTWAAKDNDRTMLYGAELKITLKP